MAVQGPYVNAYKIHTICQLLLLKLCKQRFC